MPDRMQIEWDATRSEISQVASYLQKHLGQRLTAYLSGLKGPKLVGRWVAQTVRPRDLSDLRLRSAYQATRLIVEAFGDQTAKAWLVGTNSQLDDEAPAFVLRHIGTPDKASEVVRAARSLAERGRRSDSSSDVSRADISARVPDSDHIRALKEEIRTQREEVASLRRILGRKKQPASTGIRTIRRRAKGTRRNSESAAR